MKNVKLPAETPNDSPSRKAQEEKEIEIADLKRELELEAALESVRASALAMHASDELKVVVSLVFEKLRELNVAMDSACILTFTDDMKGHTAWAANPDLFSVSSVYVPYHDDPISTTLYNSRKKGTDFIDNSWNAEDKNVHWKYLFQHTDYQHLSDELKQAVFDFEGWRFTGSFNKNSATLLVGYSQKEISDLDKEIIKRFGKVFEQAYIRFLDLQKAEKHAREAQIEAALERVRSHTMAMQNSDDLREVVRVVFAQLESLGFNMDHCMISLFNEEHDGVQTWYATTNQEGYPNSLFIPRLDHPYHDNYWDSFAQGKDYAIYELAGKSKDEFLKLLFEKSDFKSLPNSGKKNILKVKKYYFCHAFMAYGALEIAEQQPATEENMRILKRFANAFEQTYTRFLDLQKAETQAREAQIEAALERVRAHTMAMQESEELNVVVDVILQELEKLGFDLYDSNIGILNKESKHLTMWGSEMGNAKIPAAIDVPPFGHSFLEDLYESILSGKDFEQVELSGDVLKTYQEALVRETDYKYAPKEYLDVMFSVDRIFLAHAFMEHGFIEVAGDNPLPKDKAEILIRFATVVDQTYTRFDDLVKAEAQAREAQIEAALERVRARSMAMHTTDELREVISTVFQQLQVLDFDIHASALVLIDKDGSQDTWLAGFSKKILPKSYKIPETNHPYFTHFIKKWKSKIPYDVFLFEGELKKSYDKFVFGQTEFKYLPKKVQESMMADPEMILSAAYMKYGWIEIDSNDPISEDKAKVLQRFAKVFEQTYTRFLDLQKAEAQAREAQIEAALERVRAASLAMHTSEELQNVVGVLYNQLVELDIQMDAAQIEIMVGDPNAMHVWVANQLQPYGRRIKIPHLNHPSVKGYISARNDKKKEYSATFSKKQKNAFYEEAFVKTDLKNIPEKRKQQMLAGEGLGIYSVFVKHTATQLINFQGHEYSVEDRNIVRRFADVFEQAYVRFLDIQKAETQAREAQIEAALERVRARGMAMHNSDELNEVVAIMFKELSGLDITMHGAMIYLFEDQGTDFSLWLHDSGNSFSTRLLHFKANNHPFFTSLINAKKAKSHLLFDHWDKKVKDSFFRYSLKHSDLRNVSEERKKWVLAKPGYARSIAVTKHLALAIDNFDAKDYTDEENTVLVRFSRVFEQTYTRFLDLQKAEAQAHEAQIEASLERVRAKTMAMHQSEELSGVVKTMFNEFQLLHIADEFSKAIIIIIDETDGSAVSWLTNMGGGEITKELKFSYFQNKRWAERYRTYQKVPRHKRKELKFTTVYENSDLEELLSWAKNVDILTSEEEKSGLKTWIEHSAWFSHGTLLLACPESLSEDSFNILQRFAIVFEQTYTRFLDLKMAEAQAREARIEAGLERIRARTMGMQKSDELAEMIVHINDEMHDLGVGHNHSIIGTDFEAIQKNKEASLWLAVKNQKYPERFNYQFDTNFSAISNEVNSNVLQVIAKEIPFYTFRYTKEEKDQYFKDVFKYTEFRRIPQKNKDAILDAPGWDRSAVSLKNSTLFVDRFTGEKFTDEENSILQKFGKVFEQTYTRFLDLKKAESQAQEARIEAALEKVRGRAMAIRESDELQEVLSLILEELKRFDFDLYEFNIVIVDNATDEMTLWGSGMGETKLPASYKIKPWDHPFLTGFLKDHKRQLKYRTYELSGQSLKDYLDVLFTETEFKDTPEDYKKASYEVDHFWISHAIMKHGALEAAGLQPLPEEKADILRRFAQVVDLTYTRFDDIVQAEAQAREAQIEAALERVRAASLAMHQSEELPNVALIMLNEIESLAVPLFGAGVSIINEEKNTYKLYFADNSEAGDMKKLLITQEISMDAWWLTSELNVLLDQGQTEMTFEMKGRKLTEWMEWVGKYLSKEREARLRKANLSSVFAYFIRFFGRSVITISSLQQLSEEHWSILRRMSKTFAMSYSRFLDLQKAEAQAREAQIEAALERVRARGMAMHKTDELQEVIKTVFDQFKNLGLSNQVCIIELFDEGSDDMNMWIATAKAKYPQLIVIPYYNNPIFDSYNKAKKTKSFLKFSTQKSIKDDYYQHLLRQPGLKNIPSKQRKYIFDSPGYTISGAFTKNAALGMVKYDQIPFPEDEDKILVRFAKVFEQTYTRFLDLQKAEAQAYEARIQTALERIRSAAMAMHSSDGLSKVAEVLREQMALLGQKELESCLVQLYEKGSDSYVAYYSFKMPDASDNKLVHDVAVVPWKETAWSRKVISQYEAGAETFSIHAKKAMLEEWYSMLAKVSPRTVEYDGENALQVPAELFYYFACFSGGFLSVISYDPPTDEAKQLLNRAANTFDIAYKRFLDLQKAEDQAREAQIEAALERVRAKASAMHSSEELKDVASELRKQMGLLGQENLEVCGIHLYEEHEDYFESWIAMRSPEDKRLLEGQVLFPKSGLKIFDEMFKHYRSKKKDYVLVNEGEKVQEFIAMLKEHAPEQYEALSSRIEEMPSEEIKGYWSLSDFAGGSLIMVTYFPPEEESLHLLSRSATVFELAYRRFKDLQKAEAQAREAQIEAALERIRASALAMHSSEDLINVVDTLRQQMGELGQPGLDSSGIHFYDDVRRKIKVWWVFGEVDNPSGDLFKGFSEVDYDSCQYTREVVEHYHLGEKQFQVESSNSKLLDWYKVMSEVAPEIIEHDKDGQIITPDKLHYCYSRFSGGALTMASDKPFAEESMKLQIRAAQVFELAYRRFLDLQQAEARAKESIMQASLDRVRGEIASMRSVNDLNRITPLIWTELKTLEVPFIRCGVMIMDEKQRKIQSHLATPDGDTLGIFDLPYDSNEIAVGALPNWRKGEMYRDHWDKEQFVKFMNRLLQSGQINNPESYQGSSAPPESLDLHFVPFKQGMLYVGNTSPLKDESIELVKSLADAFSIAYARYEDFTKLEETKRQIEQALEELKATQSQLIHSEKMASLGELTAGIAHEIQNPLNFVNNFSEVSADLLNELKEELANGNSDEVLEISKDLVQNLEKIHEHGERASSIVKGMLAHSRTGIKEKEPLDINKLTDEYLRLAYHGFRAKDKTFNAQFKTEFDESLPKVNVISQDIGRVLLNLINNAFYAVSSRAAMSKSKGAAEGSEYQPTVIVKTRKQDKNVLISIMDNGPGIPQEARDKIFQPFYTTKPAGEGTGLGLSLSYDIITKGHDGHLEVETEAGMGTSFVIQLPII